MATPFDTFRLPQTRPHAQFIPYIPPVPKPPSRRYSRKNTSSRADEWHDINEILGVGPRSNTQPRDRRVLAPTSHGAEVVDLTCLDGGKNDEIGDSGGNDDEFCSQDEREKVGSKQSEPLGKVDVERRNKNLNQSATVEGSQENAIVLNDDQDERDTDIDSDDLPPWEDDTSTQTGNQLEGLEMSALECHQKESLPTGMEDVISSKMVEGVGSEDLPPCTNDEEYEHRPREDDKGTRTDNQLEGWGISALARHGEECPPISVEDAINPEMVEGEGTQVGGLSRRELTSTPPKFNIDNSPLLPSCDGKAKKTMHFADPLSMTNTKSSDTLEPNHIISEINRDARSDRSIYQPTQEASGHTIPKATTHQPQQPIENKAKRQGDFPILENASSSGGSDGDGDDDDDDKRTTCGTLLTRKRKHSPPANTISRKRCNQTSNTTSEQNPKHATHTTRRQKPSPLRSRPLSNRSSALKPASGAQHGGGDDSSDDSSDESSEESGDRGRLLRNNKRPKSTASLGRSHRHESKRDRGSVQPSQYITESTRSSFTHPPSHVTAETRSWPSTKGTSPRQAQRQLPEVAIHPLSSHTAFLTALFRNCGDTGTFSSSQAVTLLEKHLGYPTELDNVTVKPLAPAIWFLTCFLYYSSATANLPASRRQRNKAGRQIDQPATAQLGLPATRVDVVASQDNDRSSDDDTSNNDDNGYSSNGHDNNEHLSYNDDEPLGSRKNSLWSQEDEDLLLKWKKEEGRSWNWIFRQFPNRSPGAVRVRWYTKLREKAQSNSTNSS